MQSLLYAGFSGFVFVTSLVARQQAQAREEQRRLNAELRATRALLAESARINERTRISRELHDLLGHHLTALSLNLEVAGHLVEGKAQEHVNQAHTLAKLLLSDVREAVSQLREERCDRPGGDAAAAGRKRAGLEIAHGHAAAVPARRSRARARAAALHAGNHHQRGAPRQAQRNCGLSYRAGRRHGAPAGARRRPRRGAAQPRATACAACASGSTLWRTRGYRTAPGSGFALDVRCRWTTASSRRRRPSGRHRPAEASVAQ